MNAFIDFWSSLWVQSPFWTAALLLLVVMSALRLFGIESNLPSFYTRTGKVNRYYSQWPRPRRRKRL